MKCSADEERCDGNDTNLFHGVNDAGELFITQGFEGAGSVEGITHYKSHYSLQVLTVRLRIP